MLGWDYFRPSASVLQEQKHNISMFSLWLQNDLLHPQAGKCKLLTPNKYPSVLVIDLIKYSYLVNARFYFPGNSKNGDAIFMPLKGIQCICAGWRAGWQFVTGTASFLYLCTTFRKKWEKRWWCQLRNKALVKHMWDLEFSSRCLKQTEEPFSNP